MNRELPPCPKAPPPSSNEVRCHQFRLITPMFGGGVDPGISDDNMPIRAASIRGQLRFWWRATRGGQFAEAKDLFARESEIFGNTERPSSLQVAVTIESKGKTYACAFLPAGKSFPVFEKDHPGYALFPFQGNARERKPIGEGRYDTKFELTLRYPKSVALDVETAVKAWANFGGLGARTRRGCGSLCCDELSPPSGDAAAMRQWLNDFRSHWLLPETPQAPDWPTIGSLMASSGGEDPIFVWHQTIEMLKQFRQGEGVGRNLPGPERRPGRSRFPEPESIRLITGKRMPRHGPIPYFFPKSFPRAEFGLPIVFHFKDDRDGDPRDTTLEPLTSKRMSSPLILKALALKNGRFMKLAMTLKIPPLQGVRLIAGNNALVELDRRAIRYDPSPPDKNSPLRYSKNGSALEAFLEYARKHHGSWEQLA